MKRATKILCILAACSWARACSCSVPACSQAASIPCGSALNLSPQGTTSRIPSCLSRWTPLHPMRDRRPLHPDGPRPAAGAVYVEYDLPAGSRVSAQMEETTLAFHSKAPRRSLPGLFQRLLRNLLAQGSLNAYPTACIQISVSPQGVFSAAQLQLDVGISPWTACAAKTWTSTLPWAPPSFPTCTPPPPPWFSWTPAA